MDTMPAKAVTQSTWYVDPAPMGSRPPAAIHVSNVSKTVVATMHALSRAINRDKRAMSTRVTSVRKTAPPVTRRVTICAMNRDKHAISTRVTSVCKTAPPVTRVLLGAISLDNLATAAAGAAAAVAAQKHAAMLAATSPARRARAGS
jgi:hypothetical protein